MKSVYVKKLNEQIDVAADIASRCCLRAERAAYLARLGELQIANQEIQSLRELNATLRNGEVSICINIADGIYCYYGNMEIGAYDKFQRARVLSVALGQRDLLAKSACWLAFLEYGAQEFERMFDLMEESVTNLGSDDPSTLARLAMLVAQTIHLGNRFELASSWYRLAHIHASLAYDSVSISALLHNMASIWTTNVRNKALGNIMTADKERMALVGAMSTFNFDSLIGATGLQHFTPIMLAQLRSAEGKWAEAVGYYESNLEKIIEGRSTGWKAWILSDYGWCLLSLGMRDQAKHFIEKARDSVREDQHPDDQAATYRRLHESLQEFGRVEEAESLCRISESKWAEYASLQTEQLARAKSFVDKNAQRFQVAIQDEVGTATPFAQSDSAPL